MGDADYAPFQRTTDTWGTYEKVRTVLMLPLVPVRALTFVLFLSAYWLLSKVAAAGLEDVTHIDRVPWRRAVVEAGAYLMRACFVLALGMWPTSSGDASLYDEATGAKANIIVSSHVSSLDVLLGMVLCEPVPGYVCKKEVGALPLIGFVARVWQCAFVCRDSKSGSSIIEQLSERAAQPHRRPIVIFPEGTTTNGVDALIHFHRGAFVPGAPVKPMLITYPHSRFNAAFDSIDGKAHLFGLLTQFVNRAHVTFLPVYVPNEEEKRDAALYARNVKAVMLKASGLRDSEATYKDKKAYLASLRGHQAQESSKQK